jgi:undecaprenyl-diphosphatase
METVSAMEHGLPEPVAVKLGPLGRYELRVALFGLAIALVTIPFGLLLQQVTTDGALTEIDESAAEGLTDLVRDSPVAITVLEAISFTGKPIFLVFSIGLPGLWIFWRGARKLAVFLAVTSLGGGVVDTIVKVAVGRRRPEIDDPITHAFGNSFPSGHAMQSVVCYGALLLVFLPLMSRRAQRVAIAATVLLALAIGVTRLALGVHFITDVLGGYALGAAWLAASVAAFEIWREERGRRHTKPMVEGVEPEESLDLVEQA